MKKYIAITFVVFLTLAATSFALKFTRDVVDHVDIDKAIKAEFCRMENPGCEETTIGGIPADQTAECLRKRIGELDCLQETKEIVYGEMTIFDKGGGKATETIIIADEEIYDGSTGMMGYYYINDDVYQGVDTSSGGYYAYKADNNEKFRGVKYMILAHVRRLDSDIEPYGYEWVEPGYVLIYYDKDGTLNMYVNLYGNYYKMSSIKKEVKEKKWVPPPEPERPKPELIEPSNQTEIEIPKKTEVPTPIPPPPVYLPGMPETADPKKEHVIPNCNSQGASVCRQDEECPDKWIKAKDSDRCCSVICTPVGKKEVPPGLEKKNETGINETGEENITIENETESNESQITNLTTIEEYPDALLGGNFSVGDKVEFLGVKGTIITGKIEDGRPSENLQINNETAPLLVYTSFDDPTYGHMALAHYPQHGEGEYDLYQNDELIATLKYMGNYSFDAYVAIVCEPELYPESQAVLIEKYRECS